MNYLKDLTEFQKKRLVKRNYIKASGITRYYFNKLFEVVECGISNCTCIGYYVALKSTEYTDRRV